MLFDLWKLRDDLWSVALIAIEAPLQDPEHLGLGDAHEQHILHQRVPRPQDL